MLRRNNGRGALRRARALSRAVNFSIEELESRRLLSGASSGLILPSASHLTTVPAGIQTIYVDEYATGGNNGQDWADAFTNLQSALAVATTGEDRKSVV